MLRITKGKWKEKYRTKIKKIAGRSQQGSGIKVTPSAPARTCDENGLTEPQVGNPRIGYSQTRRWVDFDSYLSTTAKKGKEKWRDLTIEASENLCDLSRMATLNRIVSVTKSICSSSNWIG